MDEKLRYQLGRQIATHESSMVATMNIQTSLGERRLCTRFKKRIPVSIHYNAHWDARCCTNNIGIAGALLDIENSGLTKNALLEITFGVFQCHSMHDINIPVIVVWRNDSQFALSFKTLNKDTEELIQEHIDSILVYHDADKKRFSESDSLSQSLLRIFGELTLIGLRRIGDVRSR